MLVPIKLGLRLFRHWRISVAVACARRVSFTPTCMPIVLGSFLAEVASWVAVVSSRLLIIISSMLWREIGDF